MDSAFEFGLSLIKFGEKFPKGEFSGGNSKFESIDQSALGPKWGIWPRQLLKSDIGIERILGILKLIKLLFCWTFGNPFHEIPDLQCELSFHDACSRKMRGISENGHSLLKGGQMGVPKVAQSPRKTTQKFKFRPEAKSK